MVNFLKVAPSTDPVPNEEELLSYVKKLNNIADYVHCDVMSKNFVSRDTINYETVRQIYLKTLLPLDVHLMVNEPLNLVEKYINAGAQIVTVHYEAFKNKNNLIKCLKLISKKGVIAGVAINPGTEVCEVMPYIAYADLVLVMSVVPGLSGQRFKESTYVKVKKLKQIREDYGARFKIEVDGGIVPEVSKRLKTLGADIIVSGSYVYNSEDRERAIQELK
ncbi:MAG: ribulose-phosphate 3-epimerase [Eubacteriales bacterium]|nr:ribulose-phosphate 3-epimerase [Eubacteriales bacterium]